MLIFNLEKLNKPNKYQFSKLSFQPWLSKKKETIYLSISLTVMPPRTFDVYMIQFFLAYYLSLPQIAEKQTKFETAQKR